MPATSLRLWDPVVRVFHLSIAGVFVANYFFNEAGDDWHVWLGYYAMAWLLVRTGMPSSASSPAIRPAERMAVLERSILRLAVWELQAGEVPAGVAIDEAVTLAKRYASPEAGSLVNGILGRVAREQGVGR